MEGTNLKEAIELAKIRSKNKKEYEDLMGNLFVVYTDFMVFERELDKALQQLEESWREEK